MDQAELLRLLELRQIHHANSKRFQRKPPRPPRPTYPLTIEREYRKAVIGIAQELKKATASILIPELPRLQNESREELGLTHIKDSWYGDLEGLIDQIKVVVGRKWTKAELEALATRNGFAVAAFAKKYLDQSAKKVLGVNTFASNPGLTGIMQAFAKNNASLITSVEDQYLDQIKNLAFTAFRTGQRWEDLRDEIFQRYDVSESRAELIARDQIGKLNAQINEVQQVSLGVVSYTWRTSLDERVRDSHAALEGKTFFWNDPPSIDGRELHPGEDYQCRCTAEPVLDGFFE